MGLRVAAALGPRLRLLALTSSPARAPALRARGIVPLAGNLDHAATLRRLAGLATHVLHLAPPPGGAAARDPRTAALLRALALRTPPGRLVYGSTSGVYGDRQGRPTDETAVPQPRSARALRRLDAERRVRAYGRASGAAAAILRIPGIYALDRPEGTPERRLRQGTPVLAAADDVYTNHIQADDLAGACLAALWRARPQRIYNASDDTQLKMGDYFDLAADLLGLPRPPRIARALAGDVLAATQLSFMDESRQLQNRRLKQELRLRLRYPTVVQGLQQN